MKSYILFFALIVSMSALVGCRKDEEDDDTPPSGNNNSNLDGTFTATINGVAWAADSDNISAVVTNFTGNPSIGINALKADSSFFTLTIPYFYGSDTTLTVPPALETELRLTDDDIFIADPGTVAVSRSVANGVETYSGTFSGDFSSVFSGQTRSITNGAFTAKRLL